MGKQDNKGVKGNFNPNQVKKFLQGNSGKRLVVSLYGVLAIAIILCGLYCFKSFFSKDKEAVAPQTESVIEPESRAPFNQNSNPSDVPSDADETPSLEDSTDNISNHNGEEESTEI